MSLRRSTDAFILALGLPVAAAASMGALGPFGLSVPARGFEEHCFKLAAGDEVHYRFRASDRVDFNIHYHRGNEVVYPVRAAGTLGEDARFTSPHADAYCLMWERKGDGAVRIDGAVERVRR